MESKKKILLVDDDDAVIALLSAKLAPRYEVIASTDPLRAIELARSEQPDLVLCDIDMPRMGGGDVSAALADDPFTTAIPLVYLTSLVSPEEARELGGQVGGRPGVSKRAPLSELVRVIDQVCR